MVFLTSAQQQNKAKDVPNTDLTCVRSVNTDIGHSVISHHRETHSYIELTEQYQWLASSSVA